MAELLKSLFKRLQEGASELGDAMHGDRIERALDQDIRAIDLLVHQARNDAATLKAQRIAKEDELTGAKASIAEMELEIASLLGRRRSAQARVKAGRAIEFKNACEGLQRDCTELKEKEVEFAEVIAQLEQKLRRAKHQLGTLRAASGIQRAQAAVAKLQPGPAPHPESAQVSAQRARQRAATATGGAESTSAAKPRKRTPAATDADVAIDALIGRLSTRAPATVPKHTTRKPR